VTLSTTPRQVECSQPVGTAVSATLTSQSPSATVSRALNTGPVNPGRFYTQGAVLVNTDTSITVYVGASSSHNATVSLPLAPGAALRLDVNRLDNVWLFAASGTPVVKILGV